MGFNKLSVGLISTIRLGEFNDFYSCHNFPCFIKRRRPFAFFFIKRFPQSVLFFQASKSPDIIWNSPEWDQQTYDTQQVIKIQARLRILCSRRMRTKIYKNNINSEKHGAELVVVVPSQIGRLSPSPIRILADITLSMRAYTLPTWCYTWGTAWCLHGSDDICFRTNFTRDVCD